MLVYGARKNANVVYSLDSLCPSNNLFNTRIFLNLILAVFVAPCCFGATRPLPVTLFLTKYSFQHFHIPCFPSVLKNVMFIPLCIILQSSRYCDSLPKVK